MLGFYDYTVILTYMSVVSAGIGIIVSTNGNGHPYWGIVCLMLCGLFDTFDGKVARSKPNRTDKEKEFGVQIDSLSDLVAFGVLPTCIGVALYKADSAELGAKMSTLTKIPYGVIIVIGALYVLCALIRLAYFNVTVEETQGDAVGDNKYYYGLPVTSVALIMPTFMIFRYIMYTYAGLSLSFVYYILMIIVAILFVMKFKLKKPGSGMVYLMVGIGAVEFLVIAILRGFNF